MHYINNNNKSTIFNIRNSSNGIKSNIFNIQNSSNGVNKNNQKTTKKTTKNIISSHISKISSEKDAIANIPSCKKIRIETVKMTVTETGDLEPISRKRKCENNTPNTNKRPKLFDNKPTEFDWIYTEKKFAHNITPDKMVYAGLLKKDAKTFALTEIPKNDKHKNIFLDLMNIIRTQIFIAMFQKYQKFTGSKMFVNKNNTFNIWKTLKDLLNKISNVKECTFFIVFKEFGRDNDLIKQFERDFHEVFNGMNNIVLWKALDANRSFNEADDHLLTCLAYKMFYYSYDDVYIMSLDCYNTYDTHPSELQFVLCSKDGKYKNFTIKYSKEDAFHALKQIKRIHI